MWHCFAGRSACTAAGNTHFQQQFWKGTPQKICLQTLLCSYLPVLKEKLPFNCFQKVSSASCSNALHFAGGSGPHKCYACLPAAVNLFVVYILDLSQILCMHTFWHRREWRISTLQYFDTDCAWNLNFAYGWVLPTTYWQAHLSPHTNLQSDKPMRDPCGKTHCGGSANTSAPFPMCPKCQISNTDTIQWSLVIGSQSK